MPAVALYRKGAKWDPAKPLGEQDGVADHIAFLSRLSRAEEVDGAGAFHDVGDHVEGTLIGLVVFKCDVAGARTLLEDDPAVQKRTFAVDLLPWFV